MAFCTLCIFIRSIYCTVELAGFNTLLSIDWLDGAMVTLAIYTLNFFHPGIWLNKGDPTAHPSQEAADEEATTQILMITCTYRFCSSSIY
ncbi:hypothetical protein BDR05DRAFT_971134 [Suillus weaverae]|nr:hypothetical protein BDR05DRAFT_971134 [Suillus weaverae]